jgi:alginate export protein
MSKKEIRPYLFVAAIALFAGPLRAEELRFVAPDATFDSGYTQVSPDARYMAVSHNVDLGSASQEKAISPVDTPAALAQPVSITTNDADQAPADQSGQSCCPAEKRKALAKKAAGAYKGVFYDNNFNYLCDPCYDGCLLGERLKRNSFHDCWIVDVGGEYRLRYHGERNHRGLGLTGRDDDFLLHRVRLYANAEYGDSARVYAEMIDAQSNYETFNPRPIEENRVDFLNLFAEAKLLDGHRGELWARIGRQELFYDAQRTVSPLDWANTRRTFDGVKLLFKGTNWDIDAFYVQPLQIDPNGFDDIDQSREFMGVYATCKAYENQTGNLYYLRLNETDGTPFHFDTFGARWLGEKGVWLAEMEGAVQFGQYGANSHEAGAFTTGIGRKMPCVTWSPTLWAYFDWASGDPVQGNGYHHMFPLAHKYLGFMDLFGRRNIQDLNFLLTANPHKKIKLLLWWHTFWLQDAADVPYNVAMGPEVATAGGSNRLGQEIDLTASFTLSPRMNLLLGYSHFFSGAFYDTNPSNIPYTGDADFFYTQFAVKF